MRIKEQTKKGCSGFPFILHPSSFSLRRRSREGQILIPSLLVIPSLFLFVYLIFETAKLSREKIRQQFAVDSAAFIQMGDYTNILNRTAYVNGAFPYRIFKEAHNCPQACSYPVDPKDPKQENCYNITKGGDTICLYKMLYDSGAVPKYTADDNCQTEAMPLDNEPEWKIAFSPARAEMNNNPPDTGPGVTLITADQGLGVDIYWPAVVATYQFYAKVYRMLGQVEDSQMTVFEHLTDNFAFFRTSYSLNANTVRCQSDPGECGNEGLESGFIANKFSNHAHNKAGDMVMWHVANMTLHGKVESPGGLWSPKGPYYPGKTIPPIDLTDPKVISDNDYGLFQLATFNAAKMQKIGDPGYDVYQGWDVPQNYFNVKFQEVGAECGPKTDRPCVHALITSQCPRLGKDNNCVWPNPTPKYQTRLYP